MDEDEAPRGEPIDDMDEETCEEIAEVLHRKYSMFAGTFPNGHVDEPFNVSVGTMKGIVLDTWFIVTGRIPLERWQDDPGDVGAV